MFTKEFFERDVSQRAQDILTGIRRHECLTDSLEQQRKNVQNGMYFFGASLALSMASVMSPDIIPPPVGGLASVAVLAYGAVLYFHVLGERCVRQELGGLEESLRTEVHRYVADQNASHSQASR